MKTNYRQKNKSGVTSLAIGTAVFLVLFSLRAFAPTPFTSLAHSIAQPLWSLRDQTVTVTVTDARYAQTKSSLIAENKSLRDQLYDLNIKNVELSGRTSTTEKVMAVGTGVKAKVISKPPYSAFDTFVLDKGVGEGVAVGDRVYIGDNVLVGQINTVDASHSQALLFSSGLETTPAEVSRTHEPVSLKGQGGGNFQIVVPKEFNIQTGDVLVDSSARQSVIAVVSAVDSSSQGSFKNVYARIPFNVLQAEWVVVEK